MTNQYLKTLCLIGVLALVGCSNVSSQLGQGEDVSIESEQQIVTIDSEKQVLLDESEESETLSADGFLPTIKIVSEVPVYAVATNNMSFIAMDDSSLTDSDFKLVKVVRYEVVENIVSANAVSRNITVDRDSKTVVFTSDVYTTQFFDLSVSRNMDYVYFVKVNEKRRNIKKVFYGWSDIVSF